MRHHFGSYHRPPLLGTDSLNRSYLYFHMWNDSGIGEKGIEEG